MSTLESNSTVIDSLSASRLQAQSAPVKELGQAEFLALMNAQLQNQDPLAPMENGDFIAQLAQFGTVSGIGDLQRSFDELAGALSTGDAVQAASLVGKRALVAADSASLIEGEGIKGAIEVPVGLGTVQVRVMDSAGELVHRVELGEPAQGMAGFSWDGNLADGQRAVAGEYRIEASAASASGGEALGVLIERAIESVDLIPGQAMRVNLGGAGAVALSDVRRLIA